MKKTTKVIVGSALSMALCASLIAGSTFALFSSESNVDIAITAGKVDVAASVSNIHTYTANWDTDHYAYSAYEDGTATDESGAFSLGGSYEYSGGNLTLTNIAPGEGISFNLTITNKSTISVKYQIRVTAENTGDKNLADALHADFQPGVTEGTAEYDVTKMTDEGGMEISHSSTFATKWSEKAVLAATDADGDVLQTIPVGIWLPTSTDKSLMDGKCSLKIGVYAVQANAQVIDPPEEDGTIAIYNAKELRAFAQNEAAMTKNVELMGNIYLDEASAHSTASAVAYAIADEISSETAWTPIGTPEVPYSGIFDGHGYTIYGLEAKGGGHVALFAATNNATIMNLTISDATVEATENEAVAGLVVAEAMGSLTLSHVNIENSFVKAAEGVKNATVGTLVGSSDGTVSATDVTVQAESNSAVVGSIPYGGLTTEGEFTVTDNSGEEKDLSCLETGAHTYMNDACVICGAIMPFNGEIKSGSDGDYFQLSYNGHNSLEDVDRLQIEEVYIPSTINGLPVKFDPNHSGVFEGNQTVRKITVEDGITELGQKAFKNCPNLEEIYLPEGPEVLKLETIAYLPKLKTIEIPASVKEIQARSIYHCDELESVTFAEGSKLEAIRDNTLSYCSKLSRVDLPDQPLEIGPGNSTITENSAAGLMAFYDTALCGKSNTFDGTGWVQEEGSTLKALYVGKHLISVRWVYGSSGTSFLTIREDTISIAVGAACPSLYSNSVPQNTELVIPDSVKFIGSYAFFLGQGYFTQNTITSVVIGSSVEHIGSMAFAGRSSKLTSATFKNTDNWFTATKRGASYPLSDFSPWNDAGDVTKAAAALTESSHKYFIRQA